jgi:hypothetical protein
LEQELGIEGVARQQAGRRTLLSMEDGKVTAEGRIEVKKIEIGVPIAAAYRVVTEPAGFQ